MAQPLSLLATDIGLVLVPEFFSLIFFNITFYYSFYLLMLDCLPAMPPKVWQTQHEKILFAFAVECWCLCATNMRVMLWIRRCGHPFLRQLLDYLWWEGPDLLGCTSVGITAPTLMSLIEVTTSKGRRRAFLSSLLHYKENIPEKLVGMSELYIPPFHHFFIDSSGKYMFPW